MANTMTRAKLDQLRAHIDEAEPVEKTVGITTREAVRELASGLLALLDERGYTAETIAQIFADAGHPIGVQSMRVYLREEVTGPAARESRGELAANRKRTRKQTSEALADDSGETQPVGASAGQRAAKESKTDQDTRRRRRRTGGAGGGDESGDGGGGGDGEGGTGGEAVAARAAENRVRRGQFETLDTPEDP